MKKGAEYWLETSEYDWDTAHDMMKSGRYVYVVFMAHLSTEKLIKGAIVELTDIEVPPKIHVLHELAGLAKLKLTEEQDVFLRKLTIEQQKTRYPEDVKQLGKSYTREYAQKILDQTKEFREWLLPLIKSEKS